MTETATITLITGQPDQFEQAIAAFDAYLTDAPSCQSHLVTKSLESDQRYLLSIDWNDQTYRAVAWYYCGEIFGAAEVVIHVDLATHREAQTIA